MKVVGLDAAAAVVVAAAVKRYFDLNLDIRAIQFEFLPFFCI